MGRESDRSFGSDFKTTEFHRGMSATTRPCHEPDADYRSPTILVVEDEILIRVMLAHHLRNAGFRIIEAGNAGEAAKILDSGEIVDVLFTDVRMPGEHDGIWLAQWARENYPAIGIAFGSAEKNLARVIVGARFFAKPYDFAEVEAHVRDLLNRKR